MLIPRRLCLVLAAILALASPALAGDVAGSHDSPLVSRYAGSTIIGYLHNSYGEMTMPLGAATDARTFAKSRSVEGELWRIVYMDPKDRSGLEVFRNYQQALQKAGYTILFSCEKDACGRNFNELIYPSADRLHDTGAARDAFMIDDKRYYLAAERSDDKGTVDVALYTSTDGNAGYNYSGPGRVMTYLQVVKGKQMQSQMVTVDAAAMAKDIAAVGHVAIYGVHFDTDKATLNADSKPALDEMAKLLKNEPDLKVYIVGHTDNVGTLDYNLKLSLARANAVIQALETTYGIDGSRLAPYGVGPLAPVASNATDAGRAKNRRVELVAQ